MIRGCQSFIFSIYAKFSSHSPLIDKFSNNPCLLAGMALAFSTHVYGAAHISPQFLYRSTALPGHEYADPMSVVSAFNAKYNATFTDCMAKLESLPQGTCTNLQASGLRPSGTATRNGKPLLYITSTIYTTYTKSANGTVSTQTQNDVNVPSIAAVYRCPPGSSLSGSSSNTYCTVPDPTPNQCTTASNPINYLSGDKIQTETDFSGRAGLIVKRNYLNQREGWRFEAATELTDLTGRFGNNPPASATCAGVSTTLELKRPDLSTSTPNDTYNVYDPICMDYVLPTGAPPAIIVRLPNGTRFDLTDRGGYYGNDLFSGRLTAIDPLTNDGLAWVLEHSHQSKEYFDQNGKIKLITSASGEEIRFTYDNGKLISKSNRLGDTILYSHDAEGRIESITTPAGATIAYHYLPVSPDSIAKQLSQVVHEDGKTTTYHYEDPRLPTALTGITDGNDNRYATWTYDANGYAISSKHGIDSDTYTFDYSRMNVVAPSVSVTSPKGRTNTFHFKLINGRRFVTKVEGIATDDCAGANQLYEYFANGTRSSSTDWNGNKTTYIYDSFNQEISRTEAHGTSLARTITTAWHPTHRLPTQIDEPGRSTTFSYDTSGSLLSKTITDTVLNQSRTWSYTYNSLGQVLTEDGPRTDIPDITTYTYYGTSSPGQYTAGDLATATNALGQVTTFTQYDANGRPLSITDANGVTTTLTYSPRGWLTSHTTGSAITTYEYDGVGQVTKVTLPDGSFLSYTYDAAHRLTDITDNAGNKVHYTLDAMGNRTKEEVFDPADTLTQTQSRVYNALNRLHREIGGTTPGSQITEYGYDNNGNLTSVSDPLSHVTTRSYDALDRLTQIIDPAAGITQQSFDARDRLSSVTDPRAVVTQYTNNALGDRLQQQSPDTGTTTHVYDAAGNVTQTTDARGVVTNYSYDALNRVTAISYPGNTAENVTFSYDSTANGNKGIGRLTGFSNDGGSTVLMYDARGNLIQQTAQVGSEIDTTSYQYDNADRLTQIVYPSGRIVSYQRDALGRIEQVQTQDDTGAAAVTIVGSAGYQPFGPLKSVAFGNGVTTTLQHDLDYRVSRITTSASAVWDFLYGYDAADNIVSLADQAGGASKSYGYDALDRLTSDQNPGGSWTFSYDANGNRLGMNWTVPPGVTTPFTYQYAAASNRLTQFNGAVQTLDAAGNLIGNGDIGYSYNHANRLSGRSFNGSPTTGYRYNALGQRVVTQDLSPTGKLTHYHYDRDGKFLGTLQLNADGSWFQRNEYLWLDELPVAQIVTTYGANNAVAGRHLTYIHADLLNTPRFMTDASQTIVWRWDLDAFGLSSPDENPDGAAPSDRLDLRFPGQILDATSGLYYNYYRDYDPASGRYVQSDPIGLAGGLNTYVYVGANPLSFADPLGLKVERYDHAVYPSDSNPNRTPPPTNMSCFIKCMIRSTVGGAISDAGVEAGGDIIGYGKLARNVVRLAGPMGVGINVHDCDKECKEPEECK